MNCLWSTTWAAQLFIYAPYGFLSLFTLCELRHQSHSSHPGTVLWIMDRNPGRWHHCHILISSAELRELHSFFCFLKWAFRCLSGGCSPAASSQTRLKTVTVTRSTMNCKTPRCRSKFGNFSFHGADHWSLSVTVCGAVWAVALFKDLL